VVLLIELGQKGHHAIVKSKLSHEVLKSQVEVYVEKLGLLFLYYADNSFACLLEEVRKQVRPQTDREVVKNLAVLAQIYQKVNNEDKLLLIEKVPLLNQVIDIILDAHACAMHDLSRL
jgi:hypothetical protein